MTDDREVSDIFPSKYLKAADLKGKPWKLVVAEVKEVELNRETKQVLFFQNASKAVVLNKTKALALAYLYGPKLRDWTGKEIILKPEKTTFQGKVVDCINFYPPEAPAPAPVVPRQADPVADMNDEIPF